MYIWHAKLKKKVLIKLKTQQEVVDVRVEEFKNFAERVLEKFDKITVSFTVEDAMKAGFSVESARKVGEVGRWDTAKTYLEILAFNGLLKPVAGPPYPAYILACTPEEEIKAQWKSSGSLLAARGYAFVERWSKRRPVAANILNYWLYRLLG